jgi:hypothetical protein
MSLKDKATTCQEQYDFRSRNDARIHQSNGVSHRKDWLPDEHFTYGKPNRVPTPTHLVMKNKFGEHASYVQQTRYLSQVQTVGPRPPITF